MSNPLTVLCLAGPTGAGKTALALEICERLQGEVINCDSRQVYRDFPVITAQPSPEECSRCLHHLYGWLETERAIDVALWMEKATGKAREIIARGHVPVLVGGTGMYFQHLLRGLAMVPAVDPALHAALANRLRAEGAQALHAELARTDPELAARLHPNDGQRIMRGLEVAQGTEHTLSWWHKNRAGEPPCQGLLLVVNTPLKELEPRLMRRIELMLEAGALDEGKKTMEKCPDPGAPGWSGIGCREIFHYLAGQWSLDETVHEWFKSTRAYAKRQITWFRGRSEARWTAPDDCAAALAAWQAFTRELI